MTYTFQGQKYTIQRYPTTSNHSLQAWSAADEHLVKYFVEELTDTGNIAIYNDRFGFLTCLLHHHFPISIVNYKSQEKAIIQNSISNSILPQNIPLLYPLEDLRTTIDTCLIKAPKSADLLKLFLQQLSPNISPKGIVLVAFMTKYFSNHLLEIAGLFFEEVKQSKAWKKSRLLILKNPKTLSNKVITHSVSSQSGEVFKQYYGVFSAKHIDYASEFLIEHLTVPKTVKKALDLASGNGVLAANIRKQHPTCEIHLLDDSFLAIESSKLNLGEQLFVYNYNDSLENIENNYFDFVVSNPPFHFDYETNIEVSLKLFKDVARCLAENGEFVLVANNHLNYKTHLAELFNYVEIVASNEKFVIYKCKNIN